MQQCNCGRLCWERVFLGCGVLDQWPSALAEIYVQENHILLGEAVPGLAGALGLIFIDTRFSVTLQ